MTTGTIYPVLDYIFLLNAINGNGSIMLNIAKQGSLAIFSIIEPFPLLYIFSLYIYTSFVIFNIILPLLDRFSMQSHIHPHLARFTQYYIYFLNKGTFFKNIIYYFAGHAP